MLLKYILIINNKMTVFNNMTEFTDFEYVDEEEPTDFIEPDNLDVNYKSKTIIISSSDRN